MALPTETVYGLAANALDPAAVAGVFRAKARPAFDPLIVHVSSRRAAKPLWRDGGALGEVVQVLTERFWPGPLTLVLPRSARVPDLVAAGLPTVALRSPAHPVFRAVLEETGLALAAPSANRFGRVSPTAAAHVADELGGVIPLILDGGPCTLGIESTVVRPSPDGSLDLLRPGPITPEMLGAFGNVRRRLRTDGPMEAPGQADSHYAPAHAVRLIDDPAEIHAPEQCALICWGPVPLDHRFRWARSLSETRDLAEAAARLFALLREADGHALDVICVGRVPDDGLGLAILNRLERAAARR